MAVSIGRVDGALPKAPCCPLLLEDFGGCEQAVRTERSQREGDGCKPRLALLSGKISERLQELVGKYASSPFGIMQRGDFWTLGGLEARSAPKSSRKHLEGGGWEGSHPEKLRLGFVLTLSPWG